MESLGQHLKRERELRDISLNDLAEATKINIRYIEAIEADQFELLPGKAFVMGFLKNYAAYIGLDEEEVITRYLDFENAEMPESHKHPKEEILSSPNKKSTWGPVFIIIIFLITAAIIYYFFNVA